MENRVLAGALAALALALVHWFAGNLRFLHVVPRSRWLSVAGGVSVAYAAVHLLPELEEHRRVLAGTVQRGAYLLTLAGILTFYGLEKLARGKSDTGGGTTSAVFWLHIGSFAVYNALIGYALTSEERELGSLLLFVFALGLHFVVNDYGLRQHHRELYLRRGRWIISAAVFLGWLIGALAAIPAAATAVVVGFLAGGILLNTFKEELPEERESRFWWFVLGAAVYAAVLLAV
jgi:hypothetical protein